MILLKMYWFSQKVTVSPMCDTVNKFNKVSLKGHF